MLQMCVYTYTYIYIYIYHSFSITVSGAIDRDALLGPGPAGPIHLLGPGPCWSHARVGPCWGHSFVGPGPCWRPVAAIYLLGPVGPIQMSIPQKVIIFCEEVLSGSCFSINVHPSQKARKPAFEKWVLHDLTCMKDTQ